MMNVVDGDYEEKQDHDRQGKASIL